MFMENNHTEYKESLTDDLEKEVVAFLNSTGGQIQIGIKDNGAILGISNPDKVQLKIKDRLINNIRPSIMGLFDILTIEQDGKTTIIVNVAGGPETPYYIKQKGRSEAGCFVRIGSSSQPMTEDMINKLMSKRHHLSLANIVSRHQDLEFEQLKLYYGFKKKTLNDNFARTLDFLTNDKKYNQVANLFSDNNNISVRIGKYAGKDKLNLIGREDFQHCCLIAAMQKVLDRFDIENITQSLKRPMKSRLDKTLVDKAVLHETIINAFAHNDYTYGDTPIFEIFSDKFVITSFGGLVEGLDLESFYSGTSMPRNRQIIRVFKDLEYVEQIGSGIPKIIAKYGRESITISSAILQTTLKFELLENQTNVKTAAGSREKSREKIIDAIKTNPNITTKELVEIVGISIKGIEKNIKALKLQGRIRRIGADKGGHWEVVD
ncbi:MAG: putative DNA binding domain-containing protein [Endomicrobium sp.]|jgi:predicted HTH transcriptional regulator|nr:putative DNA binding domain-containing protein [Endomicrobium sp.]